MAAEQELTILMKAKDEASAVIGKLGKNVQAQQKHFKAAGLAVAGLGAGVEALARKQAPLVEATRKLAIQTGFSEDAIRDMATELSNATFPLDEVLELMKLGSQRGLESEDALKKYATFWDTIGDATGLSSENLAKSATGLETLGVAAGEEEEVLAAFGLVMSNGAGDIREFLKMIEKVAPDLNKMDMTVDEAAQFFVAMQEEMGLTSKVATTEFKEALEKSTTGISGVMEILGLTEEQMTKYKDELAASGGVAQEMADAHASTKTVLEGFESKMKDLVFQNSAYIEKAAQVAPLLLVLGPAMMAFGAISTVVTAIMGAMAGTTGATTFAFLGLNIAILPFTAIVLGIIAAVVLAIVIWKNWDKIMIVLKKTLEVLKATFKTVFDFIKDIVSKVFSAITAVYESKLGWLLPAGPLVKAILFLKDNWDEIWGSIKSTFKTVTDALTSTFRSVKDAILSIWDGMVVGIKAAINSVIGTINGFIQKINSIKISVPSVYIPPFGPTVGGFSIGMPQIPEIPTLARGGEIMRAGLAVVGERGRELVSLPRGAEVSPLTGRGGTGSINVTVNVQGSVLGAELSDIVAEGVEEAQRRGTLAMASAV